MDNSTIAAISTPLSAGGVGIIRISGPRSLDILFQVFRPFRRNRQALSEQTIQSHRFYHGYIVENDQLIDEVMVVFMRAPRSYTGEDVIEIHAHSGPLVLRTILMLLIKSGARLAGPGEFTRRAFLNGKMDLTQAEAIADIIDARSRYGLKIAVNQATGKLKSEIDAIKELFIDSLVEIEAAIDFSDHTDDSLPRATLLETLQTGAVRLNNLIEQYNNFSWQRSGIMVALVGAPNVGKSTLLNTLLGRERAIVAPTPGTTRDFIQEALTLEGHSFVFTDTAGLRKHTADDLEKIGMERTQNILSKSDAVVFMIDAAKGVSAEDHDLLNTFCNNKLILVANKIDLPEAIDFGFPPEWTDRFSLIRLSALTGEGVSSLKTLLVNLFGHQPITGTDEECGLLPNLRQKTALEKAFLAVKSARDAINGMVPEDLVAIDLREAIDALNEITGHSLRSDVLNDIFSRFCIGK